MCSGSTIKASPGANHHIHSSGTEPGKFIAVIAKYLHSPPTKQSRPRQYSVQIHFNIYITALHTMDRGFSNLENHDSSDQWPKEVCFVQGSIMKPTTGDLKTVLMRRLLSPSIRHSNTQITSPIGHQQRTAAFGVASSSRLLSLCRRHFTECHWLYRHEPGNLLLAEQIELIINNHQKIKKMNCELSQSGLIRKLKKSEF
jgi:hypothetical protein